MRSDLELPQQAWAGQLLGTPSSGVPAPVDAGAGLHSTHTTPGEPNEVTDPCAPCGAVTPDSGVQAAPQPRHRNAPLPSHH